MSCFICSKAFSETKVEKEIVQYCEQCNFYKTKDLKKYSNSYKSEFWENSDFTDNPSRI